MSYRVHGEACGYKPLKPKEMEFLLQMFADFLGTPNAEEENAKTEMVKEKEINTKAAPIAEEINEKEPVIFGLMQFH